jgi:hypothetical protein
VATREQGDNIYVDLELVARLLPPGRSSGVDTIDLHLANPNPSLVQLRILWARRKPAPAAAAR